MASSTVIDIDEAVEQLNTNLSRASLDANNNDTNISTEDVLDSIDQILEGFSISMDEFDRISQSDLDLLNEDVDTMITIKTDFDELPNYEPDSPPNPLQERQRIVHLYTDETTSSDSISPPPTISPIPRQRIVEEYKPWVVDQTRPLAYNVRVFGRQYSDYRSDTSYFGSFTTPFVEKSINTKTQFNIFVDKALYTIQGCRPFNFLRSSFLWNVSSPEVTYVSSTGNHVSLYPRDFPNDVNEDIPQPWISNDTVLITVSVLINVTSRLGQDLVDAHGGLPHSGSVRPTTVSLAKKRRRVSPYFR